MSDGSNERRAQCVLEGIGVSPGYAIGRAHLVDNTQVKVPKYHLEASQTGREWLRFEKAVEASSDQIEHIKSRLSSGGDQHYLILEAHQLILRDEMLVNGVKEAICDQRLNAEWALNKVGRGIKKIFEGMEDAYFRERGSDIDFVTERIMRNLMGTSHPSLSHVAQGAIVIARDLSPADTAFLMRSTILGFATDVGGRTSHTAIMARSLELPAVVGLDDISEQVGTGDTIVVDGAAGQVIINPSRDELRRYQRLQMTYTANRARLDQQRDRPAQTADGVTVHISGNIETPTEAELALQHGANDIGLFRTEFLYMSRETLPSEAEQLQAYRQVLEHAGDAGATIRTLDLGGDKFIEPLRLLTELNPIMGLRAIRFCLKERGIFRAQIRALLRASAYGQLRIMAPLISGIGEVRQVKAFIAECRAELLAEGLPMAERVPFGIMVELPSAAAIADLLAREVDFFAIGTNDLIQYTLAIDRGNEHVAHLYRPLHPALLRMIHFIVQSGRKAGISVSMCGEMAGDPFYTAVLLGLGLRTFSMTPSSIPLIKSVIRSLDIGQCEALFKEVRRMADVESIEACVGESLAKLLDGSVLADLIDPRRPLA